MAFTAIGTRWSIRTDDTLSEVKRVVIGTDIARIVEGFDRSFSRFRDDSWVMKLSREAGAHELPEYAHELLSFYERLYQGSGGLVTPLIGQVMTDAGYGADYALQGEAVTTPPAWDSVIRYDTHQLTMREPALLDFGAAGKGLLVDIIGKRLDATGLRSYVIDASGDILHRDVDEELIVVGLEDPSDASRIIGTVDVYNQSLCASAGSRRQWGKYHHIINPQTLESPRDVLAAWALAGDTMTADGLATALFFVPAARLRRDFAFEYLVMRQDRSVEYSKKFPVKF